jgi:hypothetical protein
MITYKILEKTTTEVTIQIEDSTQWNFKGEKDIKVKKMKNEDALAFFTKLKSQRQEQQIAIAAKITAEIAAIDQVLTEL